MTDSTMHEDDSPWLDDELENASVPVNAGQQISTQEWDKISARYSDAGYRDGITAGKNDKLQAGFDQGFAQAVPYARELGTLRGTAATMLAILTTSSGAKHVVALMSASGALSDEDQSRVVGELRDVVNALGKLDANRVLPVDKEAEAHARSHADEGISQVMRDRKEMREMEDLVNGLGGGPAKPLSGLAECRERLERVSSALGLDGLIPPRRY
ncbi:hypothetical protein JCM10212_000697 [Sporobolomyces blumeae]